MTKQITRISPHQSSKVIALMYGLITLPFVLIGIIAFAFVGPNKEGFPLLLIVFAPILYAICGYLFFGLFCLLYNLVVKWVGGIEFETTDHPDA